jgi:hypothetical protein
MGIHALWNAIIVALGYGGLRATYAPAQPDSLGLVISIVGMMMLAVFIGLLPIALTALNRRFRSREIPAFTPVRPGASTPPASAKENKGEAS